MVNLVGKKLWSDVRLLESHEYAQGGENGNMNEQAKAAMDALPARQGIGSARLENDYNFTDTATHRYRYQAVYRVVHGTI